MKSIEELHSLVAKKIEGFCRKNGESAILQPVNYIMTLGGKRLRPIMCMMSANLFSDDIEDAIYPALAIEIFHNFSLMHDDIMDKAPIRRGLPTVHHKWNENVAILSGDAMLIQSYQLLMKTRPEVFPEIMRVFNQTALEVCEGQQMDMDFEKRNDVSVAEYEEMIRLKTSVLLAGAMKIGAIIGGASVQDQEALYQFGIDLGLSFQLRDDYLDVFGDAKVTGKQRGGDIIAGKKTFLLLRSLEIASGDEKRLLLKRLAHIDADIEAQVSQIIALYRQYGVDEELKKETERRHFHAIETLKGIHVKEERLFPLMNLANQLLDRES